MVVVVPLREGERDEDLVKDEVGEEHCVGERERVAESVGERD